MPQKNWLKKPLWLKAEKAALNNELGKGWNFEIFIIAQQENPYQNLWGSINALIINIFISLHIIVKEM